MEGLVAFGFYICRAAEYHPLSQFNFFELGDLI